MLRRALCVALIAVVMVRGDALAQQDSGVVRVHGTAFDSITNRPLADAFVGVVGGSWHTQTDSRGRFQFDSISTGFHAVVVQHPLLDTLGFPGISARMKFSANEELRISTPSYATMWKRMCGARPMSKDSGFVYGMVRDVASNRPIADALVSIVWRDSLRISLNKLAELAMKDSEVLEQTRKQPTPKKNDPIKTFDVPMQVPVTSRSGNVSYVGMRIEDYTDSRGFYAVCGVPAGAHDARILVAADSVESDSIDARTDLRIHRRDFRIPMTNGGTPGVVTGQLTDLFGTPVPYARVAIGGAGETRSDDSGHFVLRDVDPGTRRLEVRFIGMTPLHSIVDVPPGDSVSTIVALDRVPTLGALNVKATNLGRILAAEFDSRRKLGLGWIVDSTTITRYPSVEGVMRDMPGLVVRRKGLDMVMLIPDGHGGQCEPTVYMDGVEAGTGHLFDLTTKEAVAIEAYVQPLMTPVTFIRTVRGQKCGSVLVWTRYAFHNR
jgi:hypothetical protein